MRSATPNRSPRQHAGPHHGGRSGTILRRPQPPGLRVGPVPPPSPVSQATRSAHLTASVQRLSPRPRTRTNHGSGSCSYSRVVLERRIRNSPAAQAVGHVEPGLAHRSGGRCPGDHQFRRHPEPGLLARWAQQPSQNRRRHLAAGLLSAAANRAAAGALQVRLDCPEQSSDPPPGPWRQPEFPRTPVPSDGPLDPWPWLPRSSGLLSPTPSWTPRDAGFPTDRSPAPSRSHSSQPQEPGEPERLQPGPLPGRLGNSHLQPTYPQNPPGPSPSGLMYPAARGSPHPSGQP